MDETNNPADANNPDSDLISQVHRLAGQHTLTQLFHAGLLKPSDTSEEDRATIHMAYPDFSKKEKTASPLRITANERLGKRLNKLLESLGNSPSPTSEKEIEKLLNKTQLHLMKTPSFSRLKSDDKMRLAHRVLELAANGETNDIHELIEHELKHSKSRDRLKSKIEGLFSDGYKREEPVSPEERDRVKEHVDNSEIMDQAQNTQAFAHGGEVKKPLVPSRVASVYPRQAAALASAKAKVHNYLNALKPQKTMGLAFDSHLPEPHKERDYHSAVDIATRPLSMLDDIHDGSIHPGKFSHFTKMHPELHDLLKKHVAGEITKMQVDESRKPSFKRRQALSLFMGQPLEQTLTPQAIQAAQMTFAQKPQMQQPPQEGPKGKSKGSPSKLTDKGPKSYQTPDQAAQLDRTAGRTK